MIFAYAMGTSGTEEPDSFIEAWIGNGDEYFLPISAGGVTKYIKEGARGGGKSEMINKGKPFAGRMQGGGVRDQIFGTWEYGSGYPNYSGRGVSGRGFPFYFRPVVWAGNALRLRDAYMYRASEYGLPSDNERPGGFLATAAFGSSSTGDIYRILADNATTSYLAHDVFMSCRLFFNYTSLSATAYPSSIPFPLPEQAVQYYRASSIVLTLDSYNNAANFLPEGTSATPMSAASTLDPALECLNTTISRAALLVDNYGPVNSFIQFLRALSLVVVCTIGSLLALFLLGFCAFKCQRRVEREAHVRVATPQRDPPPPNVKSDTNEENPSSPLPDVPRDAALELSKPTQFGLNLERNSEGTLGDSDAQSQSSSVTVMNDTDIVLEEAGRVPGGSNMDRRFRWL